MKDFNAGSFSALAEEEIGKKLWKFLNERESFIRMETASELSRPALEGMQVTLLANFKEEDINQDRMKQMMGRMARQIMEANGHSLDQTNVKISNNILFSSAARYKKK